VAQNAKDWPHIFGWVDKLPVERMSQKAFDSLRDYSCSNPTGVVIGKVWRRNLTAYNAYKRLPPMEPLWIICEYVACDDPSMAATQYRRPEIVL
jgi:hypothetical protein